MHMSIDFSMTSRWRIEKYIQKMDKNIVRGVKYQLTYTSSSIKQNSLTITLMNEILHVNGFSFEC